MKYDRVIVLDVGGTNIKAAIVDADGNLLAYRKVPSNACMGGATLMRTIEDVIM